MFGLLWFVGVRFFRLVVLGLFFGDGPLAVAVAPAFIDGVGCACDGVGASGGDAGVGGDDGGALGFVDGCAFLVGGVAPVVEGPVDASNAALCLRDRSCLALLDLSMYDAPQI